MWKLLTFGVVYKLAFLFTIPAIVCGHLAKPRINRFADKLKGYNLASMGLVFGYVCLFLQVLGIPLLLPVIWTIQDLGARSRCCEHLHYLDKALVAYCSPPATNYPSNLDMLSNDLSPDLFVCPGSGNKPGSLTNVMEWTDYIYVTGLSTSTPPGVPVLLCPPENHKGKGGSILDTDHSMRWSTNTDCIISNIMSATSGYTVVVSKRLTEQSHGKYKSKP